MLDLLGQGLPSCSANGTQHKGMGSARGVPIAKLLSEEERRLWCFYPPSPGRAALSENICRKETTTQVVLSSETPSTAGGNFKNNLNSHLQIDTRTVGKLWERSLP